MQANLGAAEGEDVHAAVGGEGAQGQAERGGGVGDAGAVHVQVHAVAVRQVRERAHLPGRVDGAQLGGLGDGEDAGLDVVLVAQPRMRGSTSAGVSLPSGVGMSTSLQPVNFSGAPHSSTLMWAVSAQRTASVGPQERAQAQHVGAGAVEDEVDVHVRAQVLAELRHRALGPGVASVGQGMAHVGAGDGLEQGGVDPRVVVAGKASLRIHRRFAPGSRCTERALSVLCAPAVLSNAL